MIVSSRSASLTKMGQTLFKTCSSSFLNLKLKPVHSLNSKSVKTSIGSYEFFLFCFSNFLCARPSGIDWKKLFDNSRFDHQFQFFSQIKCEQGLYKITGWSKWSILTILINSNNKPAFAMCTRHHISNFILFCRLDELMVSSRLIPVFSMSWEILFSITRMFSYEVTK